MTKSAEKGMIKALFSPYQVYIASELGFHASDLAYEYMRDLEGFRPAQRSQESMYSFDYRIRLSSSGYMLRFRDRGD